MSMKQSEAVTLIGCIILCIGGVLEWKERVAEKKASEAVWVDVTDSEPPKKPEVKPETDDIPFATD